jgi:transcriptional regulator with XRE-family HTH domain
MGEPTSQAAPRHPTINASQIREARAANRMTQEELARFLGVSARTVSNWERGSTVPRNRGTLNSLVRLLSERTDDQPLLSEATHSELVEIAQRLVELVAKSAAEREAVVRGRDPRIPAPRAADSPQEDR